MKWHIAFLLMLIFPLSSFGREVSFSWEPMEGASEYEIQVSKTDDFSKPFLSQKLQTPSISSLMDPGKYFYRVRVIDQKKHPGKWSNSATVTVASLAPELTKPATGYETSYYEHQPDIEFEWKAVDITATYEIVIVDGAGTEVTRTTVDKASYKGSLPAGDYQWQVRSMGKSPIPGRDASVEEVPSEYSKFWKFKITKISLSKPILKTPLASAKISNHTETDFSWSQDPHSHFADVNIEELDVDKPDNLKFDKLKDKDIKKTIEKPGHYRWSVTAKEEATTPGVTSDTRDFYVLKDSLFAGNYELELNMSYGRDVYNTNSSLQVQNPQQINQTSMAYGGHYGLSLGYYVFRGFGFFVSAREAPIATETLNTTQKELDAQMRFRFGANGFFQEFWFGYRQMDIIEAENIPTSNAIDLSTTGPLFGTRIGIDLPYRLKLVGTGYYYKPLNFSSAQLATLGPVNADVFGGSVGLKYNFYGQWWVGYRYALEYVNGQMGLPLTPPYVNSSWGMTRAEPFYLSISFEK
jgi:hypothetical protein